MNLAETQLTVKKWAFIVVIMTFTYYTGKFVLFTGFGIYQKLFPKEIPAPEASFGKLPTLEMPTYQIKGTPTYTLETDSGFLPQFPDRINVYKIIQPTPNLLAESRVKELATDLYFTTGFTKKSISEFQWIDANAQKQMTANVITQNFSVKTQLSKLASVVSNVDTITEEDAINMASGFIKSKALLPKAEEDTMRFETIPSIINLARYQDMTRFPRQAKVIKVNVYRSINQKVPFTNEYKNYDILGPNPKESLISFFVTNHKDKYKFPDINFTHWNIDMESKSTYPISNVNDVWNIVQSNKGVIAYVKLDEEGYYSKYTPIEISEIKIRDVSLAYYEQTQYTQYLQPIYVFKGTFKTKPEAGSLAKKGDIVIYYPAVTGEYIQPAKPKEEKETKTEVKNITPKPAPKIEDIKPTGIQ